MTVLFVGFAILLLIPVIAAFFVIINLLGWAFGILVDAAIALLALYLLFKVLDEIL